MRKCWCGVGRLLALGGENDGHENQPIAGAKARGSFGLGYFEGGQGIATGSGIDHHGPDPIKLAAYWTGQAIVRDHSEKALEVPLTPLLESA